MNRYVKRNQYRQSVHQLELEEPGYGAAEDTFYVDGVEFIDECEDTLSLQVFRQRNQMRDLLHCRYTTSPSR